MFWAPGCLRIRQDPEIIPVPHRRSGQDVLDLGRIIGRVDWCPFNPMREVLKCSLDAHGLFTWGIANPPNKELNTWIDIESPKARHPLTGEGLG